MHRPRIGITTSYHEGKQSLDYHYIRAVEAAGGLPLIVPMLQSEAAAAAFSELLDGLIVTGGPGITINLMGDLPDDLPPTNPIRTHSDTLMLGAMAARPVLGICYGMQFINAAAGGSIYADVQGQHPGALIHSKDRGATEHPVTFEPDSHFRAIVGAESLPVNTYHIQAVVEVGEGLRVAGRSLDGVIEAIESVDGRVLGVQFHPERMGESMQPLFESFVESCRARSVESQG
jgi:putative glutamine amidotransferase